MALCRGTEFWLTYKPFGNKCVAVELVDRARAAIILDTAERAHQAGFERVRVFSTEEIEGLETERTGSDQLIGSVVSHATQEAAGPVCYAGSGMPAMTVEDWSAVLRMITSGVATTNRMFSCDWIGVPDGRTLGVAAGEHVDNRFAQLVRDHSGVQVESFDRSPRSLLDVDTPADLVVLKTAARAGSLDLGRATLAELNSQRELDESVRNAIAVFETMTRRQEELVVVGRVSGSDWAVVDRNTACRVRVLSEERGLRSRMAPARSLLGELYTEVKSERFVQTLESLGDAVIWDTRPFYSHLDWNLSRGDRFAADLGRSTEVQDEELRELLLNLSDSRVLMGGHSLVSGGMLAGIDASWTRRELSG
jgi:hypothetical protein